MATPVDVTGAEPRTIAGAMAVPASRMAEQLAGAVLSRYVGAAERDATMAGDAGPAVLAALLLAVDSTSTTVRPAIDHWLDELGERVTHVGMFGHGLSGFSAGAAFAARTTLPELAPASAEIDRSLARIFTTLYAHPGAAIGWQTYDLVTGPAAVVMAITERDIEPTTDVAGAAGATDELLLREANDLAVRRLLDAIAARFEGMRVNQYADDELRSWNTGHVNTGLAHGVGGVIAALTHAYRHRPDLREQLHDPLMTATHQLAAESYIDQREMRTWPIAMSDEPPPPSWASRADAQSHPATSRQAWCYGTPGLAWTLWNAGDALDDDVLRDIGLDAMESYVRAFDPSFHLDWPSVDAALGACHGAAGILAIADGFERSARCPGAKRLADDLVDLLSSHTDDIIDVATTNATLMTGASGVAAMLLTRLRPELDRSWLAQLTLR